MLQSKFRRNAKQRRAFTLVELIVVLVILAVLLVVIVPRVTSYVSNARETATQNSASAVLHAAELYIVDRERDGLSPDGTFTSGGEKTLDSYLDNLDDNDSYTITIATASTSEHSITGTYVSGNLSVAIPSPFHPWKSPKKLTRHPLQAPIATGIRYQ